VSGAGDQAMPEKILKRSLGWWSSIVVLALAVCLAAAVGWLREPRQYRADPPVADALGGIRLMANEIGGTPPEV